MGTRWSADQVLALAPDLSSQSAGRSLSTPTPWSGTGTFEALVWGLCRGSSSKPYQTVVDLDGPAYRCSCPSRKLPCKHALGLLLLWAGGGVPDVAEPVDFAAAWAATQDDRATKAAERQTRAATPKDPEQAARTAARRQERVTNGLAELDVWLHDQVRTGIAGASADAYRRFDGMAARMVDAQAPGVAGTLRRLPQVTSSGSGWPGRLLAELAQLRLLVAAHQRLAELPEPLAATVRQRVGYTVAADEVLQSPPVRDLWHVLGSTESDSGNLITRRTWLWAADADRPALVLTFGAGGQQPDRSLVRGTAIPADLHFYPGQPPLRALLGQVHGDVVRLPGVPPSPRPRTIARLLDDHAAARAHDPWLTVWPTLLDVRPARGGSQWRLVDEDGDSLPLRGGRESLWPVLAVSGGAVVTVAAELADGWLLPLGAWPRQGYAPEPVPVPTIGTAVGPVNRTSVAWDELVTAATVGTGTRPLPQTGFHPTTVVAVADESAEADGAARLLELAAMETTANAVTVQPAAATPVEPAPAERRPVMTDRLADLLLLAVRTDRDVATDLLDTVAEARLVLPPAALPAFLELGRDSRITPALTGLVGERGRWLVDLDEEWAIFLPRGSRAAEIAALRVVDPAAARELVETEWADAPADDRVRMLDALAQVLGVDDVPFLESALRDRSAAVGVRAATLLTRLGGRLPLDQQPPFGERAIQRARRVVRLVRHGLLRSPALEVVAPEALDQAARGDLVSGPEPGFRKGQRAWWLEQIIQRAPLSLWENEFGRSPAELVALPVVGDFARELHPGWRAAAWAQRNLAWVRAFLALADAPVEPFLVGVLPAGEQAALAARVLDSVEAGDGAVLPLLTGIDGPWPPDLATAVVGYVERLLATGPVRESAPLLQLVARRLPVRAAFTVTTIQARATSEDWADRQARSVGFDHPWRALLTSLSATLSVRARLDDELRRSAP